MGHHAERGEDQEVFFVKRRPAKRKLTTRLRSYWKYAHAQSLANGKILVTPIWTDKRPGVLTRLAAAFILDNLIDQELKKK